MSAAGELKGALNGAASSFAIATATGTLVFAPLGPEGVALGIVASLVAAVVGGFVASLLSSTPLAISAPRAAVSIVIAGLAASLHRQLPQAAPATIVALCCIAVSGAGMLQLLGSAIHLGRLVRFVPFPVVAGFTHGIALTLVLAYTPIFAGLAEVPRIAWPHFETLHLAAPFVGGVTLVVAWACDRGGARWPTLFLALAAGLLAHLALARLAPGADVGPLFRPATLPVLGLPGFGAAGLPTLVRDPAVWRLLLSFAVAIAAVASIDSLMGALSAETRLGFRSRPDRDLAGQGAANLVSGAVGGLAISYTVVSVQAAHAAGGRGRVSGALSTVFVGLLAAVMVLGLDSLALAVLAALMMFVATKIADPWGFDLLRRVRAPEGLANPLVRESFFVYLLVAISMVLLDIISALTVGLVASAALFVRTLNRHLVRRVTSGRPIHSRCLHSPGVMRMLAERMRSVAVIELEGPLFFGTADRIVEEVEALDEGVRYVIVDLSRVQTLDATAAAVLTRVSARLRQRDRTLVISGGPDRAKAADGERPVSFPDLDRALEWVERRFIEASEDSVREVHLEPAAFVAAMGLDGADADALLPCLETRDLRAGDVVFRDGDPGDELYFLLSGRVSIMHGEAGPQALRVVTFLPGNIFGNVAFADTLPRTASALCDADCRVVLLRRSALVTLAASRPEVVTRIYVELAADIAGRLRATDELLREGS